MVGRYVPTTKHRIFTAKILTWGLAKKIRRSFYNYQSSVVKRNKSWFINLVSAHLLVPNLVHIFVSLFYLLTFLTPVPPKI